jgi:hypothetical protein
MRFLFSLAALLFLSFSAKSQEAEISGILKNPQGEPLDMANVLVLNQADSSMISFAFTDDRGRFKLKVAHNSTVLLRMSYLGLRNLDTLLSIRTESTFLLGTLTLEREDVTLAEAEVVEEMPITISGDTIIYKAEAFTTGEERKLENVLEQLPGFEVDDNGEVKVQGKTVEKVMVEGQDFFDGDTKLATKNIPANAVDKVQVLQNYNEVDPLRGVDDNDRIALNIKLKDGKKNIFFGDVSAQGGLDERYLVHPNLFFYSPKASYNFIGDLNNIGVPAFTQQDFFRFNGGFRGLNSRSGSSLNIASDNTLGASMVSNTRANEITSRFGALNFNIHPSKAWNWNGFAVVNETQTLTRSEIFKSYLNPQAADNRLNETLQSASDAQNTALLGKLGATYTPNTALHVEYTGLFKASNQNITGYKDSDFGVVQSTIGEQNTQTPIETKHSLSAFYEANAHNISSVEAEFLFKQQNPDYFFHSNDPQLSFPSLPLVDTNRIELLQQQFIQTRKGDFNLNHYFVLNNTMHLNFLGGTSLTEQHYTSGMDQLYNGNVISDLNNPLYQNDVHYMLHDYFVGMRYKVKLGKLIVRPGLNAHYYRYDLRQSAPYGDPLFANTFLLPEFFAKYDFRKTESVTLTYNMQAQFTDVNNFYPGLIINSYNSLRRGNTGISNALAHSFNLGYYRFDMFNFINVFGGIVYSRTIDALVTATDFNALQRVLSPINAQGTNDLLSAYGSFDKRFTKWKFRVGGNLSYTNTNTLIQNVENLNSSFTQAYDVAVETNFKQAPNIEVGYRFVHNSYQGNTVENTYTTNSPFVKVEAPFLKSFSLIAEYAYNNYQSNGTTTNNYDFLSANLYYQKDGSPWEFSLNGMNLLNTGILREDGFTENLISTSVYYVMPRYVLAGVKYEL